MKKIGIIVGTLALAAAGCAHKDELKPDKAPLALAAPAPTPTPQAVAVTTEAPKIEHYVVRKGDSLWKIAADQAVLGDAFRWPLLYKQNRDQCVDPDLIETGQELGYKERVDAAEAAEAIQQAKDTPVYVKHTQARKPLPLKY